MTRETYIFKDGTFQAKAPDAPKKQFHSVITDEMPETEHPANRQIYTSRRKFRAETNARGLEECYGEPEKYWKNQPDVDQDEDMEQDVLKAIDLLNYGEGISDEEREKCKLMEQREDWEAENS